MKISSITWSDDGKSCTAKRVCSRDTVNHVETAEANVTCKITTPATCIAEGTTTYTATFDVNWAETQTTERVDVAKDPDNHVDLVQVDAKAPTCTEIGWDAYEKCESCKYTTYVEKPALDHDYKSEITTAPGYTEEGVRTYICQNDTSHTYTEAVPCIPDEEAPTGTVTVKGLDSSYNNFIENIVFEIFNKQKFEVTISASDDETGVRSIEYYVSEAPLTQTELEDIDASKWIAVDDVNSPTDIFVGDKDGDYIVYVRVTDRADDYTDHPDNFTYISTNGLVVDSQPPVITGIENGAVYCDTDSITFNVSDLHLNSVTVDGTEVTDYTLIGTQEGSTYNIVATDKAGNKTEYTVTLYSEHSFTNYVETKAPTCTEPGSETAMCDRCDDGCDASHTREISALGHDWGETVIENNVPSTCTAEGSYDEVVYCATCGKELSRKTVIVEKLPHIPSEPVEENEVKSTCTVAGSYEKVVYCATCGEELSRETKELPLAKHTPGEAERENVVESTCTVAGSYEEVVRCTVCDKELSRETKSLELADHIPGDPVIENLKPATCEENGSYDKVINCTVCGTEISREAGVIAKPENGHSWDDNPYDAVDHPYGWRVTVEPTFDVSGEMVRQCANHAFNGCTETQTKVIDKLIDNDAPTVTISEPDHDINDKQVDYDKDGVVVSATATDTESDIDTVTYVVMDVENNTVYAEGTYDPATGIVITDNGEYVVTVTATDEFGNKGTATSDKIIIDTVAPNVTPEATESFDEIKVKVEDKYLDKVVVIVDGTETEVTPDKDGYITIPKGTEETKYYTIVATDKAGNETKVSVTAKYDGTAPVPSITTDLVNVDHNDGEADYTNDSDVVVIITAEDNEGGSGVDHIDYVITDENGNVVEEGVYDENNKPVLDKEGKYTVTATATDKQGNKTKTPVSIDVIIVDHNAPVITDTTNDDRSTTVNVKDNFALNDVTVNKEKVAVDEDGNYIIPANNTKEDKVYEIVVTDKAGNVSDTYVVTVPGDKTGPSITAIDDEAAEGETNNLNDETVYYDDDSKVEITIEASDDESGVSEITYVIYDKEGNKIGEGTYDPENKPVIESDVDGEYTVIVTVTDNAGNKTEEELDRIVIDVTDPEIVVPEDNCAGEDFVYCVPENNTITIDVIENNVESVVVKVNGEVNDQYTGKELVLTGSEEGSEYEITVTDVVEHITTVTVRIYSTHSFGEWETLTPATCVTTGEDIRYCVRCNAYETRVTPATGHTAGKIAIENLVKATCTEDGSYDEVTYCDVCHEAIKTNHVTVPAFGHDWGETTYTWSEDGKSCVATRVCNRDADHVETATATVTGKVTVDPTCAEMGTTTYTATFEESWTETQTTTRVDVAKDSDNHVALEQVEAKAPTCTEIGWNAYEKCDKCGYTTYVELPAHGHKPGDEVIENEKEMTYDEATKVATDGGYDTVVYCTVCNCELSRETTTLHPVAYNVQQKTLYTIDTFQYGLDEAATAERVILLECITVDDLNSLDGDVLYLDLNGYILTVTGTISMSANAHIVDFSEGDIGRMIVPEGQKINERNIELSIWDAEAVANGDGTFTGGYYFIDNKIVMQQLDPSISADGSTVKLTFRPIITDRATTEDFFSDGALDERIKIGVVFTLTDAQGKKYDDIKWLCTDELVKVVYNPSRPRAFEVTLDISDYALCSIKSIMISDLGVIRDGEEITVEGLGGREEEVPTPGEWE